MFYDMIKLIFGLVFVSNINYTDASFTSSMLKMYSSGDFNNDNSSSMRFSTAFSDPYILNSFNVTADDNSSNCQLFCQSNEYCRGVFEYQDDGSDNIVCNSLNNIGSSIDAEEKLSSISYKKHLSFSNNTDTNSLNALIFTFDYLYDSDNTHNYSSTIYLDLNNNGYLDEYEPNITTNNINEIISEKLRFTNITRNSYHLRQILHDDSCKQIYPGVEGSIFYSMAVDQNFYVSKVKDWNASIRSGSTGILLEYHSLSYVSLGTQGLDLGITSRKNTHQGRPLNSIQCDRSRLF